MATTSPPNPTGGPREACDGGATNADVRAPYRQLHGGYGYMTEYPVAKAFTDSRIQTIYGGTTEIMKEIIGRSLLA